MRWLWVIIAVIVAGLVWTIDDVFALRLGCCMFSLSYAGSEAAKALAPSERAKNNEQSQ
jgi:ABC-type branched-subunit amino acid transport system permease subunit